MADVTIAHAGAGPELRKRTDRMPRPTEPAPNRHSKGNKCPLCGVPASYVRAGAGNRGRYCCVEHRQQHTRATREAEIRESAALRAGIARPTVARARKG